ncbi:SulP family inorganic anion transporter [Hymenobacter sp. HSC-4F20]|uniref:SulP family inorganic anion transporter n=1 Tax=Hymenobacter sp. HSC-4F20 TaxID=2864135 RepID=UPI001C73C536|nr:SulP family inorganic anion transporter [Hymenobacter sp. HSC-4F20]MBX0290419.1 SulP family inorganic anion transporter [Hymenobacter sp. HSC-4F20]
MLKATPVSETSVASQLVGVPTSPWKTLNKDLPAGLVVFLVALPLCLGISLASGAPLLAGIIAGIVGGVLVSWLSGSQLSVSGPAAGLTAIMLTAIKTLGSFEAVLAATVIAGGLQLVLGAVKAGIIGLYFPTSVIRGMLAAIGLILLLKQIPHFVGADADYFEDMNFLQFDGRNTFTAIQAAMRGISAGSALVGLVSLSVLLFWDNVLSKQVRMLRLVPGALIVVVLSIGLNNILDVAAPVLRIRPEHLVSLPNITAWSDFTGLFTSPDWMAFSRPATYTVAFTIAIVASLETLLSVEAVDKLDPYKRVTPPNRELLAQGVGNIVSGLLGGLPMTAVIVRSSANINAGGQTRLSAFFHGLLLLTSLLFLESVLNQIPLSALAAVLLVVGYKLTKPALYRTQWNLGWQQFLPFIVTIIAILFTDLLKGVTIGLVVGIFYILKANYESAYFLSRPAAQQPGPLHLKLSEQVTFLNKASIVKLLNELPRESHVLIDGSDSSFIDYDVLEAIENFRLSAPERGITVELRGIEQVQVLGH